MIELDRHCIQPQVIGPVHGLDYADLVKTHGGAVQAIIEDLWQRADHPHDWLGWLKLGEDQAPIDAMLAYAESVRGQFDQLIIVGIGGSALGPLALFEALLPSYWNEQPEATRNGYPKYYFIDNVDADKLHALKSVINPERTLVNVITKSGTTPETIAGFFWLKAWFEETLGAQQWKRHFVVTTDPVKGPLRQLAQSAGLTSFAIPPHVGGRFSIFSPVGLLPAALLGLPIQDMIAAVQAIAQNSQSTNLDLNLAAQSALIHYGYYLRNKTLSVLMPYSAKLSHVADWYVQLWAESLGKQHSADGSKVLNAGSTPLKAVGVTDQHSQVQLFNEGPFDKLITFIHVSTLNHQETIPAQYADVEAFSYLGNRTFNQLLQSEALGTQASLIKNQRPSLVIRLARLTPASFAQLLYFFEFQTAVMGYLLGINPFDQPGVELGKQYTYALMNRPGFEGLKADLEPLTRSINTMQTA